MEPWVCHPSYISEIDRIKFSVRELFLVSRHEYFKERVFIRREKGATPIHEAEVLNTFREGVSRPNSKLRLCEEVMYEYGRMMKLKPMCVNYRKNGNADTRELCGLCGHSLGKV